MTGPVKDKKSTIQIIWGAALLLVGLGVFFRIPQVMPMIQQIDQYASALPYIRFCLYLLGILLVGGGIKKIWGYYLKEKQ
jgi:hypothetical protein